MERAGNTLSKLHDAEGVIHKTPQGIHNHNLNKDVNNIINQYSQELNSLQYQQMQ